MRRDLRLADNRALLSALEQAASTDRVAIAFIFDQNILGGMCARVCPTETLCEQACVREAAEGKPVKIGLLQRHATDGAMRDNRQFYERAAPPGKKIAVVGGGAGGSCLCAPAGDVWA